jgi:hypothetical protein
MNIITITPNYKYKCKNESRQSKKGYPFRKFLHTRLFVYQYAELTGELACSNVYLSRIVNGYTIPSEIDIHKMLVYFYEVLGPLDELKPTEFLKECGFFEDFTPNQVNDLEIWWREYLSFVNNGSKLN